MADIFNVEPPRWLQAIAQPIDTKLTGRAIATVLGGALGASARQEEVITGPGGKPQERGGSWFQNFLGAMGEAKMSMADPLWRLKANELQLGMLKDMVGIATADTALKSHKLELANLAHDTEVWPKWLAENHDNVINAPPPDLRTGQFNNLYQGFLGRQTAIENGRVISYTVQDLLKRRAMLSPDEQGNVYIPQPGDSAFDDKLKAAEAALIQAEKRDVGNRKWDVPPGLGVERITTTNPWTKAVTVYAKPNVTGQSAAIASLDRRVADIRKVSVSAASQFSRYLGQPPTPELLDHLAEVEKQVLGQSQVDLQSQAAEPGASVTVGPYGVQSVSRTNQPLWTAAEPPPRIQLTGGGSLEPRPRYRPDGQIAGYDMVHISPGAPDRLVTPDALSTIARNINDQLTMAGSGTNPMAPELIASMVKQRDTINGLIDRIVESQIPAIAEQIRQRKEAAKPPPPLMLRGRGTGATSGSRTNYDFSADGVLKQ